ncbi:MAG: Crp/Fnr family transcriptional regulator [Pirellulaceae bacterium]
MTDASFFVAIGFCCRSGAYDYLGVRQEYPGRKTVGEMQIFTELSEPFVQACGAIRSAKSRDWKSKQAIYLHRDEGKTLIIQRGYVRLGYVDASGKLLTRMLLSKGAIFGDMPFRPAFFLVHENAVASGAARILEVERHTVEKQVESDSTFQSLLLHTLAAQYSALDRRMQWQLVSPIRSRAAMALHDLICFSGGQCRHGHLIDIRLTHEEFSELIGAARPVVSGILSEFKAMKLIDYTRGHICILELEGLLSIGTRSELVA